MVGASTFSGHPRTAPISLTERRNLVKRRSIVSAAFALVASMSLAGSTFAVTGITNGSFEDGTPSANPFDTVLAGDPAIAPWTVDSGSIDWIGSYWPASDGLRSIDLNGFDTG